MVKTSSEAKFAAKENFTKLSSDSPSTNLAVIHPIDDIVEVALEDIGRRHIL